MAERSSKPDYIAALKESLAIVRANVPKDGSPYYGLFSGGKDSVLLKYVVELAGVPVEWHYNVTTIDPPELIKSIHKHHPDVKWDRPKHGNFFNRALVKGYPSRVGRWCCAEYKEGTVLGGVTMLMGIRAQESSKRAALWGTVVDHPRADSKVVNPIFNWDAEDLWECIRTEGVPYCSLYDEGFDRLGCIGCPMSRAAGRKKQFARWPRYEAKWKRLFQRLWAKRHGTFLRDGVTLWFGDRHFYNWEEMYEWWLSDRGRPPLKEELSDD